MTDEGASGIGAVIARIASPFTQLRPVEATSALLVAAQAFVLLTVYSLLKPLRESWILPGGAELKTYLAAAQALGLAVIAKGYDALARRVRRDRMIAIGGITASLSLVAFGAAARVGIDVAVAFYFWLGAFQLLLIAQLWSFASDLYTAEQGPRIFPLIGAGAALGSVTGAEIARLAVRSTSDPSSLLGTATGLALLVPVLAALAHARHQERALPVAIPGGGDVEGSVMVRMLADPYLRLLAAFTILFNTISTVGEYALDRTLLESAASAVAAGDARSVEAYVGTFKADYYAAINLVVIVLQLFAVSRVLRVFGTRAAIAILPVVVVIGAVASLGLVAIGVFPLLAVLATQRVLENGIAHSIQSTTRQALFLVTGAEARWTGRAFIDTAAWRAGDVLGAVFVAVIATSGAPTSAAIACALAIGTGWTAIALALGRAHQSRVMPFADRA